MYVSFILYICYPPKVNLINTIPFTVFLLKTKLLLQYRNVKIVNLSQANIVITVSIDFKVTLLTF